MYALRMSDVNKEATYLSFFLHLFENKLQYYYRGGSRNLRKVGRSLLFHFSLPFPSPPLPLSLKK